MKNDLPMLPCAEEVGSLRARQFSHRHPHRIQTPHSLIALAFSFSFLRMLCVAYAGQHPVLCLILLAAAFASSRMAFLVRFVTTP
ncbi:hypothetical protein V1515DRAFT_360773 [Lipomyces mesembrius]